MILTLLIGLTSGCVQKTSGDYCDIASPLYFADQDVVKYLSQHDTMLLREIVISNETWNALCGGNASR
jgi:hypothetical protein